MDNQLYRQVMDLYRTRQEANWRIEQQRKDEVFAAHPDIAALAAHRHDLILKGVASIFQQVPQGDLETLMADYNRQIRQKLSDYGYPEDYLAPVYTCPLCRDTGFVGDTVRQECACFRRAYAQALSAQSGEESREDTFERFDLTLFPDTPLPGQTVSQRACMQVIRTRCERFADTYPAGETRNLLLHGGSGLGKTYLMHCIADRVTRRGLEAVYVTSYELLNQLRNAYFRGNGQDDAFFSECQLLLIDDLGMEPLFENVTVELFYNLLNQRVNRALGTVVSTNLNRVELKKRYTERFTSRLLDTRTCLDLPFYGEDVRTLRRS